MSVHELNSYLIYIHPPIAVLGHILVYAFTILLFLNSRSKTLAKLGLAAWAVTLAGLITGMYWAQIAWGSYWSWDPKESLTLILFILVSLNFIAFNEGRIKYTKYLSVASCLVVILTFLASYVISGLHSFLG
jgi:ABC-type transport system involved in cytochrome c biogenesis permease subunit